MSNEIYNELKRMQERERNRLISDALEGHELTNVQRRQLELEIEASTRFKDGELLPVDADGSPLTDPHGWPTPIQQHIRQTAKTLLGVEPQAQPQDKAPADGQELFDRMKAAQTDEERVKLYAAYKGG
jgi:hypothetical protein